eukprot:GDKI01034925.1.p1 GENE.GDKI01034925.1~~GDKI01034925.1.p1  ORF type:complete len:306 (+),score=102.08 GDKI01034925.1:2-919(+)
MYVPQPVVSLAIKCAKRDDLARFGKALQRFQREDPTFRMHVDEENKENIIAGMGELHLEIYVERMKREYNVTVETGEPRVNFRETITQKVDYDYLHKKQTGGQGQYGRVIGYFEPIPEEEANPDRPVEFVNRLTGNDVPPNYVPSIEKGFRECAQKGLLSGSPVINIRFEVHDGASHEVDSSDLAFRTAASGAFHNFYMKANPIILEPIMKVEVTTPKEFQANALSSINRRKGTITNSCGQGDSVIIEAEVPLKDMFGYISDIRSCTQGQGEFSMEFARYQPMTNTDSEALIAKYQESLAKKEKK